MLKRIPGKRDVLTDEESLMAKMLASAVIFSAVLLLFLGRPLAASAEYEHSETRELVALVDDAAPLVSGKGEAAFDEFRVSGSRWRQGESYIFVLDLQGNMLVHPDPSMEGQNEIDLKDVNGKPIIRGLLDAVTTSPNKTDGWYHYQWPVPNGLLPRWKSSYAKLVKAPSGKSYVVASGVYNDRMEKPFVVDMVKNAVHEIEKNGEAAFQVFHDPTSPFLAKDAYIFVMRMDGIMLVNPAFPNLEGKNLLDVKDTQGKPLIRDMIKVAQTSGSGWVDYMWPKPGESASTQKSTYVSTARLGDETVIVGCGVYLAEAPKAPPAQPKMTAPQVLNLVHEAAALLQAQGEKAYPEFRMKPSKWFHDDVYLFVWTLDGTRVFHAANPEGEGQDVREMKDILGRPIGKMFLEVGSSPSGEGWVHYMYPEPGNMFPTWKSTFLKRVTFPSGKQYLVGCGIYNMQMDEDFIKDVVNRASALVEKEGKDTFEQLRDKRGPFVFMDTYVFVTRGDGIELVNPGQPSLEGKNLIDVKDVQGQQLVRDYIAAAEKEGGAWVDYYWYKPGQNEPAKKHTYVRKVQSEGNVYIVGSGFYPE
jgi:signal transduction histidine kinase